MEKLTERERRVYDFLCENIEKNGYSPSVRDIKTALAIKSTSTVHSYLERLDRKGYISKEQGKSRTVRIGEQKSAKGSVSVPVLGQVAAGIPILAEENFDGYIEFSPARQTDARGELFALLVRGESMIEAGIMDGDYVIVNRTCYVDNGDIAVVMVGDEATVKTFYRENGQFRLQPQNSTMKPIIAKDASILGKVIANVRYYE